MYTIYLWHDEYMFFPYVVKDALFIKIFVDRKTFLVQNFNTEFFVWTLLLHFIDDWKKDFSIRIPNKPSCIGSWYYFKFQESSDNASLLFYKFIISHRVSINCIKRLIELVIIYLLI